MGIRDAEEDDDVCSSFFDADGSDVNGKDDVGVITIILVPDESEEVLSDKETEEALGDADESVFDKSAAGCDGGRDDVSEDVVVLVSCLLNVNSSADGDPWWDSLVWISVVTDGDNADDGDVNSDVKIDEETVDDGIVVAWDTSLE